MKKINLTILKSLFIISLLLTISCEKSDDLNVSDVVGTYTGTLYDDVSNKSSSPTSPNTATAVVTMVGDKIEVHCYSEGFDETIMLDLYREENKMMVCLTGTDFESMYGHMMGQGNMQNMNMQSGSEWMRHLNNEHGANDEHFGNFDMEHNIFEYTFRMNNGDFHFKGSKN